MFRLQWGLCACIYILTVYPPPVFSAPKLNFGMLLATSGENRVTVCASYVSPGQQLPNSEKDAASHHLMDLTRMSICSAENNAFHWFRYGLNSSIIAIDWPNCSIVEVAEVVQHYRGSGILIAASVLQKLPSAEELKERNISIPTGVISKKSFKKIKALDKNVFVKEFIPPHTFYMDYAIIVVWILVMLCVILGTIWEPLINIPLNGDKTQTYEISEDRLGEDQKSQMAVAVPKEHIPLSTTGKDEGRTKNGPLKDGHELSTAAAMNRRLGFSILKMVIVIIIISTLLILLYFYYDIVVYVVMTFFFLISCAGMFYCLSTFKFLIPCSFSFKIRNREIELRSILIFLMVIGFLAAWISLRHRSYGWIFQDILLIFAALRCVSKLELYNLKVSIVVLLLFFLYNTFMAFGTPSMTPDNKSVLLAFAVGGLQNDGTYKEYVPMSIRVPSITNDPFATCIHRDIIIGLIDIVLPGCVVCYCYNFGRKIGFVPGLIYFIGGLAGQGIGLFLTFLAMQLLKHGQPAMLYVVPTLLLIITVISLVRKEFNDFWNGTPKAAEVTALDAKGGEVKFLPPPEEEKMISPV